MDKFVLIDTTSWIEFFRDKNKVNVVAQEVEKMVEEDKAAMSEVVFVEVAKGIKHKKEYEKWKVYYSELEKAVIGEKTWEEAANNAFVLGRKGITVPTSDLVIATTAIENEMPLMHEDKHYKIIANHLPLVEYSIKLQ